MKPKTNDRRITINVPAELLKELNRLGSPNKRNQIIVEATSDYVRKMKRLRVLRDTAGAWDDASHPDLNTLDDIEKWMRQIRSQWNREALGAGTHA